MKQRARIYYAETDKSFMWNRSPEKRRRRIFSATGSQWIFNTNSCSKISVALFSGLAVKTVPTVNRRHSTTLKPAIPVCTTKEA